MKKQLPLRAAARNTLLNAVSFSLTLLILGFSQFSFAQSALFSAYSGDAGSLNESQNEKLAAIEAKGIYKSVMLVTYDPEAIFDTNGLLTVNVNNSLKDLPFKSYYVDYQSPDDYTWIGQFFDYRPDARNEMSSMTITRLKGDMIVKIQTDVGSFITYNLGDGVHALAEFDPSRYGEGALCNNEDNGTVIPLSGENKVCSEDRLKILVAYTAEGAASIYPHNIDTFAQTSVNTLGGTFLLSGVNLAHLPVLAHAQVVPTLVESPASITVYDPALYALNDLNRMSTDPTLISLRANKQADLVVIITRPYKDTQNKDFVGGWAKQVGASFDTAYALVTARHALDDTQTFTHEVCHLLGAYHEAATSSAGPARAHAYSFTTGWLNNNRRRTVVHSGLHPVLQYLSNPQVTVSGKAAGDYATANNSAEVDAYLPTVKAFYSDYALFTPQITMAQPAPCKQNGMAHVAVPPSCKGPFTYQWSYSDNGLTWTNIPSSNTNTITTFVPLPSPTGPPILQNYNTRLYKVAVTGPLGTVTATKAAVYNCYERAISNELRTTREMKTEIKATASVSPVPATNVFTVNLNLPADDEVEIQLFDLSGRQVASLYKGAVSAGLQRLKFENKYVAGNYLLTVKGKNITETIKIIIK
ncbi:MAG: T9SS type A sorting domain-containing protein [Chryseobacterium sp.]|jgi:hypothetical protein|uniref:T9SS type A sorting domain-containing protein n=1 Tax=Chryseobacterium sp. TaxID=1871047 RepID=UPI002818FC53|nr:T9SS type A sorting domain-containing protein [Chryseobacterium sp.]MDR2235798.1 T9SS type A sorting domain-containing protein [Chryseobacterium sp.]